MTSTVIFDLARATLDALLAAWPSDAVALPERAYVAFGQVAWDCEQVTVAIERTFGVTGDIVSEQMSTGLMLGARGVSLAVSVIRCQPTSTDTDPPTAAAIEASALIAATDAQAIVDTMVGAQRSGTLAGCHGMAFENWTAQGPQGGLGGGTQNVRMALF